MRLMVVFSLMIIKIILINNFSVIENNCSGDDC